MEAKLDALMKKLSQFDSLNILLANLSTSLACLSGAGGGGGGGGGGVSLANATELKKEIAQLQQARKQSLQWGVAWGVSFFRMSCACIPHIWWFYWR